MMSWIKLIRPIFLRLCGFDEKVGKSCFAREDEGGSQVVQGLLSCAD